MVQRSNNLVDLDKCYKMNTWRKPRARDFKKAVHRPEERERERERKREMTMRETDKQTQTHRAKKEGLQPAVPIPREKDRKGRGLAARCFDPKR